MFFSYGYHHNPNHPQHEQFYFSKPRYEIQPYSQELVAPQRHTYSRPEGQTTVEIQQSQGYEIKEIPEDYSSGYRQNYVRFPGQQHGGLQAPSHEEVPVIVLKVPGPSKYAAHLKTLLQQYLEIRAAEVIRELEQQEHAAQFQVDQYQHHQQLQQQQDNHQQYRQHQSHHIQQHIPQQGLQTHVQYATPASTVVEEQNGYHQQYHNSHSVSTAQTLIDDEGHHGHAVYGNPSPPTPQEQQEEYLQGEYQPQAGHTVYEDHQTQYVQAQQAQAEVEQEYYQQQRQQAYLQQHQEPAHPRQHHHHHPQGHIMYVTGEPHHQQHEGEQQQYVYSTPAVQQEQVHNVHPTAVSVPEVTVHHNGAEPGSHLETPENYPDEKHTRVVFTKNLSQRPHVHQHHQMVLVAHEEQPAPDHFRGPIYLPTAVPTEEDYGHHNADQHLQQQQQQQLEEIEEHHHHHHHHLHQQQQLEDYDQHSGATPGPFITITQKRKMNRVPFNYHAHGRVSTPPPRKRDAPYTQDEFNKFNKLVNRLKKKQTMLINERSKKSPSEQQTAQEKQRQE